MRSVLSIAAYTVTASNDPQVPPSIPCAICRAGTMALWRESETVVIYRCEVCRSLHAEDKPGVIRLVRDSDE